MRECDLNSIITVCDIFDMHYLRQIFVEIDIVYYLCHLINVLINWKFLKYAQSLSSIYNMKIFITILEMFGDSLLR